MLLIVVHNRQKLQIKEVFMQKLIWISLIVGMIAGCGGVGGAAPVEPLTLTPPGELRQDGTCDDTILLEDWLQSAEFYQLAYIELLQTAPGQSRQDLYIEVNRLNEELVNYAALPAPDCVVDVQRQLLEVMQATLVNLQAYVNGEQNDLQSIINQAQVSFSSVRPAFDALIFRMEQQYRQLIPTPTLQGG